MDKVDSRYHYLKTLSLREECDYIAAINCKKSEYKEKLLASDFESIVYYNSFIAFHLTYDNESYIPYWEEHYSILLKKRPEIFGLLLSIPSIKELIVKNVEKLSFTEIMNKKSCIFRLSREVLKEDPAQIKRLAYSKDLQIRSYVMQILVSTNMSFALELFDGDFTSYFCNYDKDGNVVAIMEEYDVSCLAKELFYTAPFDKEQYERVEKFIFSNYPSNHLASLLFSQKGVDLKETANRIDMDMHYLTSCNYKYQLMANYQSYISKPFVYEMYHFLSFFVNDNLGYRCVRDVLSSSVGHDFMKLTMEYLEKSTSKSIHYVGRGITSVVFRVGDYVVKYIEMKFFKKECPNSFLINKVEKEIKKSNENGDEEYIQVQKYLKNSISPDNLFIQKRFVEELANQGYYLDDHIFNGNRPNCLLLDSYKDADCEDPEQLPDWFKEYPLVLVDRDLVGRLKKNMDRDKRLSYPLNYKK